MEQTNEWYRWAVKANLEKEISTVRYAYENKVSFLNAKVICDRKAKLGGIIENLVCSTAYLSAMYTLFKGFGGL